MSIREKIKWNNDLFFNIVLLSSVIGGVLHFGFIFYYLFTDILEMVFYNIISTFFFAVCFLLVIKDKSVPTIFLMISVEVILHALLSVYYIGYGSGFSFFIFTLPAVHLLYDKWSFRLNVGYYLGLVLSIAAVYLMDIFSTPVYALDSTLLSYTKVLCAISTAATILLILFTFRQLVQRNESELRNTYKALEKKTVEVSNQLESKEILLKEIHHRVKNNLQLISSLINLQKNKLSDKRTIQVLSESRNRIHAMALVHKKLYEEKNQSVVDFRPYLDELINSHQNLNYPIKCTLIADHVLLDLDTAIPLSLIANELVTNSFKHAFTMDRENTLDVILTEEKENGYVLKLVDNGPGLPEGFSLESSESLGMEIVNALSNQIDADISFNSTPTGTAFEVHFLKN